ncbi:hypothetical protein EGJ52_06245 [Pseudomonas luteola]|nr:hypothetical protein EGJ52_06245 [Pseudomonas luteola]
MLGFRWCITLGRKFFKVVPGFTMITVIATVFGQFFLIAGYLLPLKILIILGSDNIPRYFPEVFHSISKEYAVSILGLVTLLFYFLNWTSEKIIERSAYLGSAKLLEKSKKILISDSQIEMALKGFQRYSQSIASLGFLFVCLIIILLFFNLYFLFLLFFIALLLVSWGIINAYSKEKNLGSEWLSKQAKALNGFAFLLSFVFIVFSFLNGLSPTISISIIILLLSRQLLSKFFSFIKDVNDLYEQKEHLSVVFFHKHVFQPASSHLTENFWSLAGAEARDKWIAHVLFEDLNFEYSPFSLEWFDIGAPDIICYKVCFQDDSDGAVLIKVFSSSRSMWAKHESAILSANANLPGMPILGVVDVNGYICHVHRIAGYRCLSKNEFNKASLEFKLRLAQWAPSSDFVAVYARSRPSIEHRLDIDLIFRMKTLLHGTSDDSVFDSFVAIFSSIRSLVAELPRVFVVPDVRLGMLWALDSEDIILAQWMKWDLEPLGFRWPFNESFELKFPEILDQIRFNREDAKNVDFHHVRISAFFSELEALFIRGQYKGAYIMMEKIIDVYRNIESRL